MLGYSNIMFLFKIIDKIWALTVIHNSARIRLERGFDVSDFKMFNFLKHNIWIAPITISTIILLWAIINLCKFLCHRFIIENRHQHFLLSTILTTLDKCIFMGLSSSIALTPSTTGSKLKAAFPYSSSNSSTIQQKSLFFWP